ncbi:class I SAM-dependent DNA methyltransferase [Alkalihalobacterium bogoriense]|uniref:class I SAM-dependent DNA methyltransferase n=1 Tax=Alkalihalobacterium bogoriense TaxID=246272 RepID=UPI00047C9E1D|nr:class I SAM-dependent methyltransferase [Alkalihalobacterium bogoriense]
MSQDNFEEYDDPILYDKENESYTPEIPFLTKWAAKQQGTIIDIACGTGRITIPLAKSGYTLIGVDVHNGMLQEARNKSSKKNVDIQWVEQDCTNFKLGIKSRLIYSVGNSFQHFLTSEDQDGLLVSVNKHLEEDGVFIFGTRFPNEDELLQPITEEYWKTYTDDETHCPVDVYTISRYDALEQIQHYTTIRKYKNESDEIVNEKNTNISLRYVYPKEMERLLFIHGFEIVDVYKDWNETPIDNASHEMVYVCKKKTQSFLSK